MKRSVPRGLFPGTAVGVAAVALRVAQVGGKLGSSVLSGAQTPAGEVQRWLGWQLWDNVRAGRSPLDASIFPTATGTLADVAGNPGVAWLFAPFHALGSVNFGHSVGMLSLLFTGVLAGGVFGGTRGVPWLGALAGAAAWWATGLAAGDAAQSWIGPGAAAAAAFSSDKRPLAFWFTLLGAATAPVVTAALLLGAGAWPLALLAAIGMVAAPYGSTPALRPADLGWVAGGAHHGVPLTVWFAFALLWAERGSSRALATAAGVALVLAIEPVQVAGFRLPEGFTPGWGAAASAAVAALFGAALGPAAQRLTSHGRAAIAALLVVDAVGPVGLGGGAFWGSPSPPPAALVALAGSPRSRLVTVVPESAHPAAGVGWIPVHRQLAARPPHLVDDAPSRDTRPTDIADALRGSTTPSLWILADADAAQASAFASALGAPDSVEGGTLVWSWP